MVRHSWLCDLLWDDIPLCEARSTIPCLPAHLRAAVRIPFPSSPVYPLILGLQKACPAKLQQPASQNISLPILPESQFLDSIRPLKVNCLPAPLSIIFVPTLLLSKPSLSPLLSFKTGSHVALAGFELTMQMRLTLKSYLYLSSAGITSIYLATPATLSTCALSSSLWSCRITWSSFPHQLCSIESSITLPLLLAFSVLNKYSTTAHSSKQATQNCLFRYTPSLWSRGHSLFSKHVGSGSPLDNRSAGIQCMMLNNTDSQE